MGSSHIVNYQREKEKGKNHQQFDIIRNIARHKKKEKREFNFFNFLFPAYKIFNWNG
jgi:hypothetical protein